MNTDFSFNCFSDPVGNSVRFAGLNYLYKLLDSKIIKYNVLFSLSDIIFFLSPLYYV